MTHPPPFNLVVWLMVQDTQGRVLLGRRDGTGYGAGLWGLPGGRVERGEALADAATREVWEEMGLQVSAGTLAFTGVSRYDVGGTQGSDFLFVAREWSGEALPLEQTSEVGWFDPAHLPADSLPWLAGVLAAHLLNGCVLSEQLDSLEGVQPR
ncbi:NUDIX domain-containing protein [Deinococcus sp. QL22]|uniref:NUDIX domain-containing protein n=1 Tax=Deinococcus sp. QL22 TaxID=2939437 RepID=UPI002017D38D|nr:NUDIX domain-containing protein [Deinococcus sp. QL22]UQN06854.1 NUDIX domain-containing protein [Deinococcus sp. QL22]